MNDTPLHSVSVSGVIVDDIGRILLIKRRDNGQWQAPGGVLELGETFEQGVVREVLEETGVLVEVQGLTGVYKNLSKAVVALVYKCRPISGAANPSPESSEVAWVERLRVGEIVAPVFAIRVSDAIERSDFPESRAHDGTRLVE